MEVRTQFRQSWRVPQASAFSEHPTSQQSDMKRSAAVSIPLAPCLFQLVESFFSL